MGFNNKENRNPFHKRTKKVSTLRKLHFTKYKTVYSRKWALTRYKKANQPIKSNLVQTQQELSPKSNSAQIQQGLPPKPNLDQLQHDMLPKCELVQIQLGVSGNSDLVHIQQGLPPKPNLDQLQHDVLPKSDLVQIQLRVSANSDLVHIQQGLPPKPNLVQLQQGIPPKSDLIQILQVVSPKSSMVQIQQGLTPKPSLVQLQQGVSSKSSLVQIQQGLPPKSNLVQLQQEVRSKSDLVQIQQEVAPEADMFQTQLKVSQPKKICFKKDLLGVNKIYNMLSIKNVVEYETLHRFSEEYQDTLIHFPPSMYVKKIEKIKNPFLMLSFKFKREFHYNNVSPMVLYHGTRYRYLDDISTYNFDWRRSGLERGHRYGKGVNFTLDPEFAGNFCDQYSTKKVIIVADVLVNKVSTGHKNLDVPPPGCDTATRENKRTFVKFSDSEFLPKYVVTFDWNWDWYWYH